MISVFTPSHDPKYLDEAYQSLLAQTDPDWEWIVLLNNGAEWDCPDDGRVYVAVDEERRGVGYYKRNAVLHTQGEILVELDHDDKLAPNALESIRKAFEANPGIGFVYSDTAMINEDGSSNESEYREDYGWTYYYYGDDYAAHSFSDHPHNAGYIWYAPNHVRAFRRSLYFEVGGYNSSLYVLDDQDLMARMYEKTAFYHIEGPLYYQRVHDANTQSRQDVNGRIQTDTVEMYSQNIEKMAVAWAKRNGLRCLDLGAYHAKAPGFESVDMRSGPHVDHVTDFLELDLPPNSVGVIRAHDFLEHVGDKLGVIEKIYTLLAHGGMLLSMTPSTDGRGAWQDPTHVAFYNENSFWYYTNREYSKYISTYVRFQSSLLRSIFPSEWHRANNIPYVQANLIAIKYPGHDFGGPLLI